MPKSMYDVLIVGAGVSGLAAGMYAGRLGLKTIVFGHNSSTEQAIGGVITTTDVVENYPGFISLSGEELAKKLEDHAREYNIDIESNKIEKITKDKKCFVAVDSKGNKHQAKAIIYAAGTVWRKLPMKGAADFENKGVSYCALCDGPLFKNKIVAVIGGSDSAAKEAIALAEHASKVYIIYRGEQIRPEPVNAKLVEKNKKIEVINQTNVTEIFGEGLVKSVKLDKEHNGSDTIELDGIFGAIGHIPLSDVAVAVGVEVDDKKEIKINRRAETNVPGFFAAGDVTDTEFKQAITGVGEAVTAAFHAFNYVRKNADEMICYNEDEDAS